MKDEAPAQFLTTKTQRPRLTPGLIERPRLVTQFEQAQTRRLTMIKGAAGFGKTSLAIAWAERLHAAGHAVAWLSLDVEDDEPTHFLSYVAHVLRVACGGAGKPAIDLIGEIVLIRPQNIVRALINSLAETDAEVFLFLDDYQLLTHPGIAENIAYLLRHAPSNLHLVLITRTEPDLPLGRWRAQNQLLEVDIAALRFDLEETRQFMDQEFAARLDAAQALALQEKTEGWPAMLRIIATTSAHSGQDFGQYLRRLSSQIRPIRSYITEMLDGLPDAVAGFLLRVSILDRLCGPLCEAVCGVAGSADVLEEIATRRLLLIPLDPEGVWFRCHPLLRGFLAQRLQAELAAEIPELHRRAHAWFAAQELWTDAIQHAHAAGDTAQAIAWIEQCAMLLLKRGELLTLLAWNRLMPASLMRRQVKVRLAIAWGMALAMRFDEALQLATEIEQSLPDAEPQTLESLGCECQTIRAVALALSDDSDAGLQLAEASLRRNSSGRWTSNTAANVALLGYWKRGDFARFNSVPWIAFSGEDGRRNVVATVYRLSIQGLVEYEQLRTASAARHFQAALALAEDHAGANSVAAAMPASLLAQLRYDQGALDEAEALVIDRLDVIDAACMLECVLRAYLVLARVALHRGNKARADALLSRAEALGQARNWGRLAAAMILERVRSHLRDGQIARAELGAAELDRLARANLAPVRCAWSEIHEYADLAQAGLLAARKAHVQSAEILTRLHQQAQAARRGEQAVSLAILAAAQYCHIDGREAAWRLFLQAADAAAPSGLYQRFADAGPEITPLLLRARAAPPQGGNYDVLRDFIDGILARRQPVSAPPRQPSGMVADAGTLSTREQAVLALLVQGQSNKDIARALSITPETVKSHVKNIFLKLGVVRRAQAVARALSLALVSAH